MSFVSGKCRGKTMARDGSNCGLETSEMWAVSTVAFLFSVYQWRMIARETGSNEL